jgi:hypothetical protein
MAKCGRVRWPEGWVGDAGSALAGLSDVKSRSVATGEGGQTSTKGESGWIMRLSECKSQNVDCGRSTSSEYTQICDAVNGFDTSCPSLCTLTTKNGFEVHENVGT